MRLGRVDQPVDQAGIDEQIVAVHQHHALGGALFDRPIELR